LVAQDDGTVKQFKLIRIQGDFTLLSKNNSFLKPKDFNLRSFIENSSRAEEATAEIMVRKNQALSLRNQFSVTEIDEDWDLMKINFSSQEEMIERVLWYLDSIKVLSPNDLRNEILNRLKELANG
jgi:predicted DNA-binding transcriptional regulator YafY